MNGRRKVLALSYYVLVLQYFGFCSSSIMSSIFIAILILVAKELGDKTKTLPALGIPTAAWYLPHPTRASASTPNCNNLPSSSEYHAIYQALQWPVELLALTCAFVVATGYLLLWVLFSDFSTLGRTTLLDALVACRAPVLGRGQGPEGFDSSGYFHPDWLDVKQIQFYYGK